MDNDADFMRKTREMFARVKRQYAVITFQFVVNVLDRLLEDTRGFGNQRPDDTDYIPTGRLRGGYRFSPTKLNTASRWEGGPYSDYGEDVVARIAADMRPHGLHTFYVVNDVAYAYIVREGLGRHSAPDDILRCANLSTQKNALAEALASVGGR